MEDITGRPETNESIQEAIMVMKTIMVKHALVLPMATIMAPTVIHGLEELLQRRKTSKGGIG